MAEISVDAGKMKTQESHLQNIINSLARAEVELNNVNNKISRYLESQAYQNVRRKISQTGGYIVRNKESTQLLKITLANSRELYQKTEASISEYFVKGSNVNWSQTGGVTEWVKSKSEGGTVTTINVKTWSSSWNEYWDKMKKDREAKDALYEVAIGTSGSIFGVNFSSKDTVKVLDVSTKSDIKSNWNIKEGDFGTNIEISGDVKGTSLKSEKQFGIFSSETEIEAMAVTASGGICCALFDDKKFVPGVGVKGKVGGSVLSGKQKYKVGTDDVNAQVTAKGSLLSADAEGKVIVGAVNNGKKYEFGVEAKGEAGAYLAKGEVKGDFEIFGIKIGASAEGKIGAGIEGSAKLTSSGAKIGAGAAVLIGGGVELEIDWSKLADKMSELLSKFNKSDT